MEIKKSPSVKLRGALKIIIPLLIIPLTALLGALVFPARWHLFTSLLIAVFSLLLFYLGVLRRDIGERRLVIAATFIALSVIGRFIPIIKPVTAITVIGALYLGAECGFLIGSLSALLSNFYFGQGPWTPFQMLAWGLIGFFAGLLARLLVKSFPALLIYGTLSGIVFSIVMDVWNVLWYNGSFDIALFGAAMLTALPHTLLYAASNLIFLLLLAKPIGKKLSRIKLKYGI